MNIDIFRSISTTYDIQSIYSSIELILEHIYDANFSSLTTTIKKYVPPNLQIIFNDYFKIHQMIITDKATIVSDLKQMKLILDQKNIIKITIAFEPTATFIEKLAFVLKRAFGNKTVVDIETDTTIVGGIIFIHEGIYNDYSLRKKIDDFFSTQKLTIEQII